jgi:hypothetical protein
MDRIVSKPETINRGAGSFRREATALSFGET